MSRIIDCQGLARLMESSPELIIVDLLPPEHYAATHIPGAVNACVYETVFLERIAQLVPSKSFPIVIYDSSRQSRTSAWAAEKLEREGYTNVAQLGGGLESWAAAGLPLDPEGATIPPEPTLKDRSYRLDPGKSSVVWTGRNLTGSHTGKIAIASGTITIESGELTSGRIVMDMTSIANTDLENSDSYHILMAHLLSEDFFEVSRYPSAEAQLKGWHLIREAPSGMPNYSIDAELTIKGITLPVQFPALIAPQPDGILAHARLELDRTAWNIVYGSGKLFEKLGKHLVNDIITLELFICAV